VDHMGTMLDVALELRASGLSIIRVKADGTKSPEVGAATAYKWKPYQTTAATDEQLAEWFSEDHPGIGVVTGAVSGNLEMLEFEGRAIVERVHVGFFHAMAAAGHSDLLTRITAGYLETSPSGGLHFYYRIATGPVGGNTKLCQRLALDDELTPEETATLADKGIRARRTLVETRGEHGFVVIAPSHGTVHPSGEPWTVLNGSPTTVATITADERDLIHAIARTLDTVPLPPPVPDTDLERPATMRPGDVMPGEDYNARATWADVLDTHGWTRLRTIGVRTFWRRPGKHDGTSAVTGGDIGDYLCVWSTSTGLPDNEQLSKWRTYAFLNHGGDFARAASALRALGYGSPLRPELRTVGGVDGPPTPLDARWLDQPVTATPTAAAPPTATVDEPTVTTHAASDDGNAELLIETYGHIIRYCPEKGRWLCWHGTKWEWAASSLGGPAREAAKMVARGLTDGDKKSIAHKHYSLSASGTTAILMQASTDPRVIVTVDELDNRPYELNTPAGMVDLKTGHVHPHDPSHLHTKMTSCAPDYNADPAPWRNFIAETFAGHEETIPYLQRLAGYSASGIVGEHALPFAYGLGRNGKGVFLESIVSILGDYATTAPNDFLMVKQFPGHETEIARLAGCRMVLCSEVNIDDRFDEAKVKHLTGGDRITARFIRQDHFTFDPTHKLWLVGNDQPTVASGGPAFWARLRIIGFSNIVPEERRIIGLQETFIRDHGPAILAWIISGAVNYFTGGLQEPNSVKAATVGYAYSQDSVARWFDERCRVSTTDAVKVATAVARTAYEKWCRGEGELPVNPKRFGMTMLGKFGLTQSRSHGYRFYDRLVIEDGPAGETEETPRPDRYGDHGFD
jgi:P4 family phage/plasmid primase-like protien